MRILIPILCFFFSVSTYGQLKSVELNENWFLNLGSNELKAEVPGEYHMDLYMNGYLLHPYTTGIEKVVEFIEADLAAEYVTHFDGQEFLEYQHIELSFEGLDTYADIYLNDSLLGSTTNMFKVYDFPIKRLLKEKDNELRVLFESPLTHHRETLKNLPYKMPSGNETGPVQVSNLTRKAAYQFGWDWAPRFVGCGIWRPVKINCYNKIQVTDFTVETIELNDKEALVEYQFYIWNKTDEQQDIKVLLDGKKFKLKVGELGQNFKYRKKIKNPKTWNPRGYGNPDLYTAELKIYQKKKLLHSKSFSYGIRTVELINEKDEIGTSFYFKVNGKDIFAKGANYVPMSTFPSQVDSSHYEKIIQLIVDANMNMIRVWGGGIYECDYFYELCDQNGIMVWQDFMFANSIYPEFPELDRNLLSEPKMAIKRLRIHPCISLWCGNNEVEVALNNWGWEKTYDWSQEDSARVRLGYWAQYDRILPDMVEFWDSTTPYVPTSPLSNWGTPENFNHSSMHYWGVWHGDDDFDDYAENVGRFMVEYGFQSYPTLECMRPYLPVVEVSMEDVLSRQKSYVGNKLIVEQINKRYGEVNDLEDWLLLSQHIQALAMKKAIQAHRLSAPHCMGTLFWQLNDCWPGPSWSVIDYDLNEKVAYEVVKKQFSPLLVVADTLGNALHFSLTSDITESTPVKLNVKINSENDSKTVFSTIYSLVVPTFTHVQTNPVDLDEIFEEYSRKDVSAEYYAIHGLTSDTLFYDNFYFGLSPAEKEILNN